jgi:FkbM family methyltransferase
MIKQVDDGFWIPVLGDTCHVWSKHEIGGPEFLKTVCEYDYNFKIQNVIHAGGNTGLYALEFAKFADNVYVFEPESVNFNCMALNCASVHNIFMYKAALADKHEHVGLLNPAEDKQTGAWAVDGYGNIPTLRIDDFNIPNVSIIHLDIEGFELIALRGAQETIKKWKPMIAVEDLGNSENYGYSIDVLESFLNQFGYHEYLPYGSERMYSCRERIVK